jgi:hypothetical protein
MQSLADAGYNVTPHEPSIHREIAIFLAADSRMETTYTERMASDVTDAVFADELETELLPDWTAAWERFLTATAEPPAEYERSVARLMEYADLRSQAYSLQVEALREGDAEKSAQAIDLIQQSNEIRDAIMADGLVQ